LKTDLIESNQWMDMYSLHMDDYHADALNLKRKMNVGGGLLGAVLKMGQKWPFWSDMKT